jgi:hypothetical protein
MGVGNRAKVVTASECRTEPIGLRQGHRERVTLIAAINATPWAIAPYLILNAKNRNASWYPDLKPQWRIGVSNNGWATNEIGVTWLKHFIEQIKGRRVDSHVLLIIDCHESHKLLAYVGIAWTSHIQRFFNLAVGLPAAWLMKDRIEPV